MKTFILVNIWICLLVIAGSVMTWKSKPPRPVVVAPAHCAICAEGGLACLDVLMPKFKIITNGPSSFQIAHKGYDAQEFSTNETILPEVYLCESAIAEIKLRLELPYRTSTNFSGALKRAAGR